MERVRAVIIKQGSLLLVKRVKKDTTYWVFPGGGIGEGETKEEALIRECEEELGIKVSVGDLIIKEPSGKKETLGDMEYFYEASIVGGVLGNAFGPEHMQNSGYSGKYEIVWEDGKNIHSIDLRPNSIRDLVNEKYFS